MKTLQHLQLNMSMVLGGIQETIIAIADHVQHHIQKIKLNVDAKTLEQEIQKSQAALGEKIYQNANTPLSDLHKNEEINEKMIHIAEKKKELEAVESIVSPYETLHDFERLLIRSDYVIQTVIISEAYHGLGKTIEMLSPPETMLIFFIKKRNQVELACGKVVIHPKDEITFLCAKEEIQSAISFWK